MVGILPLTNIQDFHRRRHPFSSSNHGLSSSNAADFVYKGANKHNWAKLQSKIKQRLMAENISYIDDEE
jgi:hypothetical protein